MARARLISLLAPVHLLSAPGQKNKNPNPYSKYARFDDCMGAENRSVRLFHDLQLYLRSQTKIWPYDLVELL